MPAERQPALNHSIIASWFQLKMPNIKTTLQDQSVNKSSDHHTLKACSMETIDSYPSSWVHVYTDGSASKGTMKAGFGAHLKFPDGTISDYSYACRRICSNYEAEVTAIKHSIEMFQE